MDKKRKKSLESFTRKNNILFMDYNLLDTAFTHPTFVFESKSRNLESNQRLEFLGDAVLGMVVAQYLYEVFRQETEGTLTKMRAAVVCESTLARIARRLQIGQFLLLGKGEEITGGRDRNSSLADAFEALIGALYLDQGIEVVKRFLEDNLLNELDKYELGNYGDYKTMVQELAQKICGENVSYHIISESGPDHNKQFQAGIFLKNELLAMGFGSSKKEAEQAAAKKAYDCLKAANKKYDGD
ncbi:MAG: ribonuclease III [Clostridia bacterium]|nr:ribonuclease III [Clostridia bacterium]